MTGKISLYNNNYIKHKKNLDSENGQFSLLIHQTISLRDSQLKRKQLNENYPIRVNNLNT